MDNKTPVESYPIYLISHYSFSSNKPQTKINHCYGNMSNSNISFYFHNIHENLKEISNNSEDYNSEKSNIGDNSIQHESEPLPGADAKELEKLNFAVLEMQNQLKGLKEDMELIKSKLMDIEEKYNK